MDNRPFPAAVFVPEDVIRNIAKHIAGLHENERPGQRFLVVKAGRYRASTDQVVLYQHNSNVGTLKADLVDLKICTVAEITETERTILGSLLMADEYFLNFLRESWGDSFELNSAVTLLTCSNLRGALLDHYVDLSKFHKTLQTSIQE